MLIRLGVAWLACVAAVSGQTPAGASATSTITAEQRQRIQAAEKPAALVNLAKEFALQRQFEPAAACIEKAVAADPALLDDDKNQTPKSWHTFWFSRRAAIREKKLAKDDATGRVNLAVWLRKAGQGAEARRLLKAALEIDKSHAEARKLAEAWNIFGGGPFRFDLRFGVHYPLRIDSLTDEGVSITPRPGRMLLLLPFAYDPEDDAKLRITRTTVKVKSDDGKLCRILGLTLLPSLEPGTSGGDIRGSAGGSPLQSGDPLWETIDISRTPEGELEVVCMNTTRPRSASDTGARPPVRSRETRGERGDVSSGTSGGRTSDVRQTFPGSGLAAFIIEVPEDMQFVEAVHADMTIKIEAEVLEMLGEQTESSSAEDKAHQVDILLDKSSAENPLIASVALTKLSMLRTGVSSGDPRQPSPGTVEGADTIAQKIETAMVQGLRHANAQVRQDAFEALVNTPAPVGPAVLGAIRNDSSGVLASAVLDQVERVLSSDGPADENSPPPQMATDTRLRAAEPFLAALPVSSASENVFAMLTASMGHTSQAVHQRAIEVAFGDGSRQSIAALASVPGGARPALVERFAKLTDTKVKEAVLRMLLLWPDQTTLPQLVEACVDMPVTIAADDDPLLRLFTMRLPAETQVKLVGMLGRASFTGTTGPAVLERILKPLANDAKRNPAMLPTLLEFALVQFRVPYQAPIAWDQSYGGHEHSAGSSSTVESLLADIATVPGADPAVAGKAAVALVGAGRVQVLGERFAQMTSTDDRVKLIQVVAKQKELWKYEALPIFLTARLADTQEKVAEAALTALGEIYTGSEADDRWKLNMAVKLGVDTNELVKRTLSSNSKLSRSAMSLLRQLGSLTSAESDQMQAGVEADDRQQGLVAINDQRASQPAGVYACMVYLDLQPTNASGASMYREDRFSDGRETSAPLDNQEAAMLPQTNVPFASSRVTIEPDAGQGYRVMAEERDITMGGGTSNTMAGGAIDVGVADGRAFGGPPPAIVGPRVDGALLVQDALRLGYERRNPLASQIDRMALSERTPCEFQHKLLGTWVASMQVAQGSGGLGQESPYRVSGAHIVLEPIGPAKKVKP